MSAAVLRKLQQAQQQLREGHIDQAAASCERVLRKAPRNVEALWLLGLARLMGDRLDEAISLLDRVLTAEPDHGAALEHLGLAHLVRGDFAKAEARLRQAAALPYAPASVFMRLGLALLHQGRADDAVPQLERARSSEVPNSGSKNSKPRGSVDQILSDDVCHTLLVLKPATNLKQMRLQKGIAVVHRDRRPHDQVDYPGLIFEGHEGCVVRGAWRLPH